MRVRGRRAPLESLHGPPPKSRRIRLGWWFLGALLAGQVVIAAWTLIQLRGGGDAVGTISIGVSAAASYTVGMLGAIALINAFAWITGRNFVWILPSDFADIPLDWPIAVALAVGVIAGRLYWH